MMIGLNALGESVSDKDRETLLFESTKISRIVFHFNKKHLSDPAVPMWTVKHEGNTYYVHHVSSKIGFETKETPDSDHTKGSIQFRGNLKISEKNQKILALIY